MAALSAAPAAASDRIALNATDVRLAVAPNGRAALVTFRSGGTLRRVLASGGINAVHAAAGRAQSAFELDASPPAVPFRNACRAYDGPELAWFVTACKAPDGSYWALQSWQRMLPNYGLQPSGIQGAWELRLSHWRGALAVLDIDLDWSYRGRFEHLFGTLSYLGHPVHGFRTTSRGVTLDPFGRNVYLDTFNSAYGSGWKRENSFVAHRPRGTFCYGLVPHGSRPSGKGQAYRATVIGPGVTPDVMWQGTSPGRYNPARELQANAIQRSWRDRLCRPN